jgi:hypothetical protein
VTVEKEVLDWLCEEDNLSVKYFTLKNLLGKGEQEAEVVEARRQIMLRGVVPKILSKLNEDGHYVDEKVIRKYGKAMADFGYLPKYKATIWQLILFAELGADSKDSRIRKTCEYVLNHCYTEKGLFTMMGADYLTPCFQGNMVYAFSKLGYAEDERVRKTLQVLVKYQRFDDGNFKTPKDWPYFGRRDRCSSAHSCYAGCSKGLKAVSTLPKNKWDDEVRGYVRRGSEYFLIHHVYKSSHNPSKLLHSNIDLITFPNFAYSDFLEILDILLDLGVKDVRMNDAIDLLKSKRKENGRWFLERDVSGMHTKIETKGRESKWATYRALNVLRKLKGP